MYTEKYEVENDKGEFQAAYNVSLGAADAKKWAEMTAKHVKGQLIEVCFSGDRRVIANYQEKKKKQKKS